MKSEIVIQSVTGNLKSSPRRAAPSAFRYFGTLEATAESPPQDAVRLSRPANNHYLTQVC